MDDLESIQSILAWRDAKGTQVGLTNVDKKLLKMQKSAQEVIVAAAVKNNYSVIKLLYADGYRIFGADKLDQRKKFFLRGIQPNIFIFSIYYFNLLVKCSYK